MRVVVSQLAALGQKTGVGHYTQELLRCLRLNPGQDAIEPFPKGLLKLARERGAKLRPRLEGPARSGNAPSWRSHAVSGLRHLGRALTAKHFQMVCRLRRYDLYHEPNFIPLPSDLPTIVTIHDLSVILHPQWHPADRVSHYEKHFLQSLDRCRHFLAVSDSCRDELIHVLGLAPSRVTRTYNGVRPHLKPLAADAAQAVLRRLGLPTQYLLHVGTIEPRKNVLMLMRAYTALPGEIRDRWPLLLVGGWGWNATDIACYYESEARHKGVRYIGYVPEEALPAVYAGAHALLYPSHYEGFGLPPLEMMSCGGAVLASKAKAVVEVMGKCGFQIDAADEQGWQAAMHQVLRDRDWQAKLRDGGLERAGKFTWEGCAAATLAAYQTALGECAPRAAA